MNSKCLSAKQIESFLYPKSLAVVGASRKQGKVGHIILQNITQSQYRGKVVGVNPHAKSILGIDIFARFDVIPFVPDLALVAVPAKYVLESIDQIARHGTKNIVIFSAGFKEIGEVGAKREKAIKKLADKYGLSILGPNCLGFVNDDIDLNATFGDVVKVEGNLRFVSQSGAVATSLYDYALDAGLGFEQFITLGNKAGITESDLLHFWLKTKKSSKERKSRLGQGFSSYFPIGMYLESLQDGEQFLEHVQKISQMDPVLVLSPGRNEAARHAMQLHTGAMASDDKVLDMALENAGALRCEGMEDMTDLLKAFSFEVAPKGPRVAVVSNAGGPGVITADAIEQNNLELAHIPQATKKKILKHLPRAASVMNPIDVLGDALATRYAKALELVLKLKSVDGAIVILTPQVMTQIKQTARAIGKVSKAYQKPILCAFMGGTLIHAGETVLTAAKIPNFRFPERAVKAFAQMWKWQQWKTKKQTQQKSTRSFIPQQQVHWVSDALHTHATGAFSSVESDEILQWADIQVPKTKALSGYADAKRFCEKHGYPVVLKISSREVIHKKDVGGVITDIVDEKMLKTALAQIKKQLQVLKVKDGKVQIQQQIESGIEVIVGIKRDSIFGPVLMIGAGGTLAELVDDMYLGFLPNNQVQVEEALKKTRIFRLLSGYRGGQKYDIKALIRLVLRLSDLVRRCEDIAEIEINPVMVTQKGAWALDGKIRKI